MLRRLDKSMAARETVAAVKGKTRQLLQSF